MFQPDDVSRTLFADRRNRFEQAAGRRRLINPLRRRFDRSAAVEVAAAARQPITLGRTPSGIERRAA